MTALISEIQDAGYKSTQWDATNSNGQTVSAGIYFYQIRVYNPDAIRAGDPSTGSGQSFVETRKMVMLK